MSQILQNLSEPFLIDAIEANTREFLLVLGRLGGGEEHNEPGLQWIIGGAPISYHNCVVRADLTPDLVDEAILASAQRFQAHNVPGSWHIGPSMRPSELGKRLLAHGFTSDGDEPGMAVDMLKLHERVAVPTELVIERVHTKQELRMWTRTLAQGFGEGKVEADWIEEMYRKIGFGDQVPWRHYLGWWRGEPVATTSLFMSAGVAGIYFVFTLPGARQQGIGAAMTVAALHDAQQLGYRIGVLTASPMGYPVYRQLGFQEYCHIELYEWPAGEKKQS